MMVAVCRLLVLSALAFAVSATSGCSSSSANNASAACTADAGSIGVPILQTKPPVPTGGTIASGTYHLTGATAYNAPAGLASSCGTATEETIVVTGTTWQWSGAGHVLGQTSAWSASSAGTVLTIAQSAGPGLTADLINEYTATSTQLLLYQDAVGGDMSVSDPLTVYTYALQ